MNAAMAPVNLFWTPSSCSILSWGRFSASSLISVAGGWMRATSSLISDSGSGLELKHRASIPDRTPISKNAQPLLQRDALFREVLHRAGMPGDGRRVLLLVLELDVLGFLVRAHQVVLVVEHRLDDLVGGVGDHPFVLHQQVGHRGGLVVLLHATIDSLLEDVLHVK